MPLKGVKMKLLVGYDGSNSAKDALALAKKHAKAFGADVVVVTSLIGSTTTHQDELKVAEQDLEYVKKNWSEDQSTCSTHLLVRGFAPGEDIVKFARENNIDEILIGIKRRSKVGKLLFGSNAQYIILKAHCPVVTVK